MQRARGGGRAAARAHPLGQYWDGRAPQEVTPPPPQTKGTVVGNKEMCRWGNVVGPFLVRTLFWVPDPLPPPPPPLQYVAGQPAIRHPKGGGPGATQCSVLTGDRFAGRRSPANS